VRGQENRSSLTRLQILEERLHVAEGTAEQLKRHAGAATLDDAFIKLTGEELVEEEGELALVED
jgi:hypothetical protein